MTKTHEKLAKSLNALMALQADGSRVFHSAQFKRSVRERLLRSKYLQQVLKGWLISSSPSVYQGDSTPWFSSFWEFVSKYCQHLYGEGWHLSPQQSLLLQAENWNIPDRVVIHSQQANNNAIKLPHGIKLYGLKHLQAVPPDCVIEIDGLRALRSSYALTRVSEGFYKQHPIAAHVIVHGISDASYLIRHLLNGDHSSVAGRLAAAFRHVDKNDIADRIVSTMRSANYFIREVDPF